MRVSYLMMAHIIKECSKIIFHMEKEPYMIVKAIHLTLKRGIWGHQFLIKKFNEEISNNFKFNLF